MNCSWVKQQGWNIGSGWLCLLVAIYSLLAFDDFGSSWDEAVRAREGDRKLQYYTQLFSGDSSERVYEGDKGPDRYPGLYDLTLAIARDWVELKDETLGHLWTGLFGWLALIGVWRLAFHLGGGRAGFFALLFIVTLPRFMGHFFINPKDIPFAAMMIIGLGALIRSAEFWPKVSWKQVLILGLCFGFAAATRIGGLLLWCYCFALVTLLGAVDWHRDRSVFQWKSWGAAYLRLGIAYLIGVFVLMLFWPYSHGDFLSRSASVLNAVTHYKWNMPVLFNGTYIPSKELSPTYIVSMFLITTPLFHLLVGMAGLLGSLILVREIFREQEYRKLLPYALVISACFFPILYVVVTHANVYNGVRHLLFVFPVIAVMVGIGVSRMLESRGAGFRILNGGLLLLITSMAGWGGFNILKLHPYAYTYYNGIVGGVGNVYGLYETDYWATAYREGAEALVDYLDTDDSVAGQVIRVEMMHPRWLVAPYLQLEGKNYRIELTRGEGEAADFYIAATVWGAEHYYGGTVIAEVRAGDGLLLVVKDRRGLRGDARKLLAGEGEGSP